VVGPRRGDLKRAHLPEEADPNATSGSAASLSLLDEIVRDGARQMLAAALQAEVAAYVEQFRDEVDEAGHRTSRRIRRWRSSRVTRQSTGLDVLWYRWRRLAPLWSGGEMLAGRLWDPERGVLSRGNRRPEEAGTRSHEVTRYLISFDDGTMIIPEEEMPEVGAAAHRVVDEAKAAGVWIFCGGVLSQRASVVATDGTVADGPYPETKAVIGGFSIIDVPSREEALAWAAKIAVACRCAQEVREIGYDPNV
jgi:hypothetical protein